MVTLVGKSSTLHVEQVLETTREENLSMIGDSVACFKRLGREVVYDAEHFFDGYRLDPDYALATLEAAAGGRRRLRGPLRHQRRPLPERRRRRGCSTLRERLGTRSASTRTTTAGWRWPTRWRRCGAGCVQVQGTINGYGERCGNIDLIPLIANLQLKLGFAGARARARSRRLTELSHFVAEIANLHPDPHAPYVGRSAFAHKGGIHVAAIAKVPESYQHIEPELVGNEMRVVVSELAGRGNVRMRAEALGLDAHGNEARGAPADQGAGEPGLPVRGGRGLVRDAGPPHRARLPAAVRAGRLHRDRREARAATGSGRRPRSSCAWATR